MLQGRDVEFFEFVVLLIYLLFDLIRLLESSWTINCFDRHLGNGLLDLLHLTQLILKVSFLADLCIGGVSHSQCRYISSLTTIIVNFFGHV